MLRESVWRTATVPDQVELLFYVDSTDPQLGAYQEQFPNEVTVGPEQSIGVSWNVLAAKARGSYLRMTNDDEVFQTPGWDRLLVDAYTRTFPDGLGAIFCADGIHNGRLCAFPMFSRKVYDVWGCFCPQQFEFFYHDTAIADIFHRIERLHYVPEVLIEHQHWTRRLFPKDDTTRRQREGPHQQRSKRDYQTFLRTGMQREAFAEKLRQALKA